MKNCGRAVTSWRRCGGNVICAKMLVVAPRIPGRGCISVAEDVPVCGPNPREGIHKAVCTAAVHRRWFWRWRKYEKNGNDILEGKKQIMYCKAPQFRTEMARCFGASDSCGTMSVRRVREAPTIRKGHLDDVRIITGEWNRDFNENLPQDSPGNIFLSEYKLNNIENLSTFASPT